MSKRGRRVDAKGRNPGGAERWTRMLLHTMQTPAWRAISPVAQSLFVWLKLEWRGPKANNNGAIRFSVRQAAECIGVANNTAAKAFAELQAKGFIIQTEGASLGTGGAAKAPAFEVTELATATSGSQGRKLYQDWRPGGDFPVRRAPANNPSGRNGKTKACLKKGDSTVLNFDTKRGKLSQK